MLLAACSTTSFPRLSSSTSTANGGFAQVGSLPTVACAGLAAVDDVSAGGTLLLAANYYGASAVYAVKDTHAAVDELQRVPPQAGHHRLRGCQPQGIQTRGHPARHMTAFGTAGFLLTVAAYIYYSVWLLLTPFVEKEIAWFHALFPDTWWALAVPTALLVLGLTCVCTFVGLLATADGVVSLRR